MSIDPDVKREFENLNNKIDMFIEHQREVCNLKHVEILEHLKDSPNFRTKVDANDTSLKILWAISLPLLLGLVGVAFKVFAK
jgi:hypothetical protein